MKTLHKLTLAIAVGFITQTSFTQAASDLMKPFSIRNFENQTFFKKSVIDSRQVHSLPASSSVAELNGLISSLGNSGGVIRLMNGIDETDYIFDRTVILKPNIQIEIEGGTQIKVIKTKLLFDIGAQSKNTLSNIAITNFGKGEPNFDLSAYAADAPFRLIKLGNVDNFYLGDFTVQDNFSKYSVISFNPPASKGDILDLWALGPRNGVVANITQINGHVGYGVVQVQTASNVLFKNLTGIGGITLRLETGANLSNQLGTSVSTIDGIWAKDIKSVNGHAAMSLSPHGKINKNVFVDGVVSENSTFAISSQRGFINTGTVKSDTKGKITGKIDKGDRCNIDSSSYGYFTNVRVKNIKATRDKSISHKAQIKSKEFEFYELMNHGEFSRWKDMPKGDDSESRRGQAINAVRMTSAQSDASLATVGKQSEGKWAVLNEEGTILSNNDIQRDDNYPVTDKIFDRKDVGLGGSKLKNCIIDVVKNEARLR